MSISPGINPVTGCLGPGGTPEEPKRCSYCYAHRLARGRLKERYLGNRDGCMIPGHHHIYSRFRDPFWPRLWEDRIEEPLGRRKPAKIFVVSMGDLFHPYVPTYWVLWVKEQIQKAHWHTFLLLTKNPEEYKPFEPWPDNCWLGTTVTNQKELRERWTALREVKGKVRFLSVEPFLDWLWWPMGAGAPHWVIIGALTGPGAKQPEAKWVDGLTAWCQYLGVPVFHKDNLDCEGMGIERRREWPR